MQPWRTAIVDIEEDAIRIYGYDIRSLMQRLTFGETVFLLHRGRLPTKGEGRLMDAILISAADHGPGAPSVAAARLVLSGNRQSVSSAVAAGILAIGNEHGGAGMECMETIAAGMEMVRSQSLSITEAARRIVKGALSRGARLAGLGHRVHTEDPRTNILFSMARECELAGDGVAFMVALQKSAQEMIKSLTINVDGALAGVLYDLGFPAVFGRLAFLIGRVAGLTAEVAEELQREKAMRIFIPFTYDGPPPRDMD
jgi:citrate synthase